MDIDARIIDNITGKSHNLPMTFDTGAYMTSVDSGILVEMGYDIMDAKDTIVDTVGRKGMLAKEIVLRGFELENVDGSIIPLGPVLAHAIDMSDIFTVGVVGLNIIREFRTIIEFGNPTTIELVPTFDITDLCVFDEFSSVASRFGEW